MTVIYNDPVQYDKDLSQFLGPVEVMAVTIIDAKLKASGFGCAWGAAHNMVIGKGKFRWIFEYSKLRLKPLWIENPFNLDAWDKIQSIEGLIPYLNKEIAKRNNQVHEWQC